MGETVTFFQRIQCCQNDLVFPIENILKFLEDEMKNSLQKNFEISLGEFGLEDLEWVHRCPAQIASVVQQSMWSQQSEEAMLDISSFKLFIEK